MTTTKKITELLVTLLPSALILLPTIPLYRFGTPPNVENPTGITVGIMGLYNTILFYFSIIIFITFIVAIVAAIIRLIPYYRWLTGKTPACPHCDSMMKVRLAKRSKYKGQYFWGCSYYFTLGCRGKIHID
jgi:hypothetical protein